MKKDSVAIITPSKFPGTTGDTATLTELIRQLASDGISVTLICPKTNDQNISLQLENVNVIRIPSKPPRLNEISGGIRATQKLKFISFLLLETLVVVWNLKKKGIRHVIVRPSILTIQLPPILRMLGIIVIADGAETISDSMRPHLKPKIHNLLRIIEERILPYYSFFKVSSLLQADALKALGIPNERIISMPFSIDMNEIPQIPISQIPENTFGYFGVLESWQGVDLLIDAFEILVQKIPSARLIIIGEGSLEDSIRNKIQDHNLYNNIQLINSVPRETLWAEYFKMFRVVIIPRPKQNNSVDNILPIKLVESMAAAKAVIASDIPVMREILASAILLFESGNADSLSFSMERLCNDKDLLKNLSLNGLRFASRYDIRENIKKILSILRTS